MRAPDFMGLSGKKCLILGEAGSGKTRLLERLLEEAVQEGLGPQVTLIDMAPEGRIIGGLKVGGRVKAGGGVRRFAPDRVFAPRLEGRDKGEVLRLAGLNARSLEPLLRRYLDSPTPILFVNDLTMYLHGGDPGVLERAISASRTFIGTAYKGSSFDDRGSGLNALERSRLERLIPLFDVVIDL